MDSIIIPITYILLFFLFCFLVEIVVKKINRDFVESNTDIEQDIIYKQQCPFCRNNVGYEDEKCDNCNQELKWE